MPQKNQIAIGKKIVGRLGKDDHWVTTSTAGWTFTAATAELPEESNRPIDVFRVHKVKGTLVLCDEDFVQSAIESERMTRGAGRGGGSVVLV